MTALKPPPALAIALYELPDGNWTPILSGSLIPYGDPRREPRVALPLVTAMSRAREWHSHDGFPVLIQPLASGMRNLDAQERDLWERTRPRPQRRTLAGVRNAAINVSREDGGFVVSYECEGAFTWGTVVGPFVNVRHAVAIAEEVNNLRYNGTGTIIACPATYAEITGGQA